MLFFQKKMSPLFLISRCSSLSLFFSLSFAGLSPTFSFFSLSLSLSPKFVGMTNNLSLTLQTTRIQKQRLLSVFVFMDSPNGCLCFRDSVDYAISRRNNLELHLDCHTC